jgi:hypothetical protein
MYDENFSSHKDTEIHGASRRIMLIIKKTQCDSVGLRDSVRGKKKNKNLRVLCELRDSVREKKGAK